MCLHGVSSTNLVALYIIKQSSIPPGILPAESVQADFVIVILFTIQLLHDYPFIYKMLISSSDNDGNSLVHVAAVTGNARLFKV